MSYIPVSLSGSEGSTPESEAGSSTPMSRKSTGEDKKRSGYSFPLIGNLMEHSKSTADLGEGKEKKRHFPMPLRRKHKASTAVDKAPPRHLFRPLTEVTPTKPPPQPHSVEEAHLSARFRFFLKFKEEADASDAINYANVRREMWLDWYSKYLRAARLELDEVERSLNREQWHTPSAKSSVSSGTSAIHMTVDQQRSMAAKKRLMSMMNDMAEQPGTPGALGKPAQAHNQDQLSLVRLWYTQIYKKMVGSESLVLPLTRHMIKQQRTYSQTGPNQTIPLEQITVLSNQKLLSRVEDSGFQDETNLLTPWEVCADEKNFYVNNVNLGNSLATLIDKKGHGHLQPEDYSKNPGFGKPLFTTVDLTKEEAEFFDRFSSFTTTSYAKLPLNDATQSVVLSQDFCLSVPKEELLPSLKECHRVLKPGGILQLPIHDFEVANKITYDKDATFPLDADPDELLEHFVWSEMAKIAQKDGYETRMSQKIMKLLHEAGFSKVSYTLISHPHVSTVVDPLDGVGDSNASAAGLDRYYSFSSSPGPRRTDTSPVYQRMGGDCSPRSAVFGDKPSKRQSSLGLGPTALAPLAPLRTQTPNRPSNLRSTSSETVSSDLQQENDRQDSTATTTSVKTLDESGDIPHRPSTATTTASSNGYRDERMNSLFEVYSNFFEMLVMFKFGILNIDKIVSDANGDPEELRKRFALIKMFIEYKAHGINFLEKLKENAMAKKGLPYRKVRERGRQRDESGSGHQVRNEGIAYFFIFIARK